MGSFLENFRNLISGSKLNLNVRFSYTLTWGNFRNHALNHQLAKARRSYTVP